MNTVYIETCIVSYLRQRPSSQVVMAARQLLTSKWWETERTNYELVVSQYVLDEASGGDPVLAAERIQALAGIPLLPNAPQITQADADRRAQASGRPIWQGKTTNQTMQRSGGGDVSGNGESTPAAT